MSLSDYIARDLEQRISRGELHQEHLKLTDLVKRYGVSFTPIRRALDGLVERELLFRLENGRVVFRSDFEAANLDHAIVNAAAIERPRESLDWDHLIRDEIVRLSLSGSTEFLREETTAAKYGIGRASLRQVFHRLSGKGLLRHVARRGWQVHPFEESDLDDYLAIREVLECKAFDLASERFDTDELQSMLDGNCPDENVRLDNRLHGYFIQLADNRYISEFFERNSAYYNAVFDLAAPETLAVSKMAEQHRTILTAALAKDWENAKKELVSHIRSQRPVVIELIQRMRNLSASDA